MVPFFDLSLFLSKTIPSKTIPTKRFWPKMSGPKTSEPCSGSGFQLDPQLTQDGQRRAHPVAAKVAHHL